MRWMREYCKGRKDVNEREAEADAVPVLSWQYLGRIVFTPIVQSKHGCAWKPIGTPDYCRTRSCSRPDFLKKCPRMNFNWTILCRCECTLKFPGAPHLESVTLLRDQAGSYQAWQQKCSSVENIPLFVFSHTPHTDTLGNSTFLY